jgi:hypothetical protein
MMFSSSASSLPFTTPPTSGLLLPPSYHRFTTTHHLHTQQNQAQRLSNSTTQPISSIPSHYPQPFSSSTVTQKHILSRKIQEIQEILVQLYDIQVSKSLKFFKLVADISFSS